jgi:hypothetical protein
MSSEYCCLDHALADVELLGAAGAAARWAVTLLAPEVNGGAARWCGRESMSPAAAESVVAA